MKKTVTELLDTGIVTGRIEALVKLRSILVDEVKFQKEGFGKIDRIKYKSKGDNVSRPLLPGLEEAIRQVEKLLKDYKHEASRTSEQKGQKQP